MDEYTACEESYKNGYDKGYTDAMAQFDLIRRDPSTRQAKCEALLSELKFCGSVHDITKVIADELSWRVVMRIVNKIRRKRGIEKSQTLVNKVSNGEM